MNTLHPSLFCEITASDAGTRRTPKSSIVPTILGPPGQFARRPPLGIEARHPKIYSLSFFNFLFPTSIRKHHEINFS